MEHLEKTISEKTVYEGKVINLKLLENELEDGSVGLREIVEHPGGVCVIGVDENKDVLMVRQYRVPFGKMLLEAPAGKLDKNEDILSAAKREFTEETGYIAKKLTYMGEFYPSVGFLTEKIHIYIGENLEKRVQNLDDDEFLDVEKYNIETLYDMVLKNEIKDAKTVIAIMLLKNYLKK